MRLALLLIGTAALFPWAGQAAPAQATPLSLGHQHTIARAAARIHPVRGARSAPINVLYWAPFRSLYTAQVQPVLKKMLSRHPGKVRLQWMARYRTGSQNAVERYAARVGLEAFAQGGDTLFWAFHDALCKHANPYRLTRKDVDRHAAQVGLNLARLRRSLAQDRHQRRLEQDQDLSMRLGVPSYQSTPVLLIGAARLYIGRWTRPAILDGIIATQDRLVAPWRRQGLSPAAMHKRLLALALKRYSPWRGRRRPRSPLARLHLKRVSLPVGSSPVQGPTTAKATVVAFVDFVDYRSFRLWQILKSTRARYPSRVRVVLKTWPRMTYARSLIAAKALYAAGQQGKAWAMADILFKNRYRIRASTLTRYARQVGLDVPRFRSALLRSEVTRRLLQDTRLARRAGVTRAPAVFVSGRRAGVTRFDPRVFWALLAREVRGGLLSRFLPR